MAATKKRSSHPGEVEKDQGFDASHGYGDGHGGPSGPGDAPAPANAPQTHVPTAEDDEVDP